MALPKFIDPMKAKLVAVPPDGDWSYEIKLDGFRALAIKSRGVVQLVSRNAKSFSDRFPGIVEALSALRWNDGIIDGEVVALNEAGRSSFQMLQNHAADSIQLIFYAFDLLHLDGVDLMSRPLEARRNSLAQLLKGQNGAVRYSEALGRGAKKLLVYAAKLGLEGLIGKQMGSFYEPGRRSGVWVKLKLQQEQEFVIGGYTDPEGSRSHFGSVLLGVYQGRKLRFAGKVGTGFDRHLLEDLHTKFIAINDQTCPFADLPEVRSGRSGQGITASQMERCHWLKPTLVCQVKFAEWTRDGRLRQPVFLGLREDKRAKEVVREKAV